jgi:hypothetical protein
MSAARALRVPAQDTDLGRTPTLQRLRGAKGLIIAALDEALDAARVLGLHPRQARLERELPTEVSRADNQEAFRGLAKRLDEVLERLDALDNAKAEATSFQQQTGLLNFYIGSMRLEVGMAKLHLTVGEHTVDLSALVRAIDVIGELTADFFATVQAWLARVSGAVIRTADQVFESVRRLAAGTKITVRWIARKQLEVSFDPRDPGCKAQVNVYLFGHEGRPAPFGQATSIRARVRAGSSYTQKKEIAYLTKIEKLTASGVWQDSNSPDIQLTWVGDTLEVEIPASSVHYVNILHVNHKENRLGVWHAQLPSSLEDFLKDHATYRFTVSVLAQGVTRQTRVWIEWPGRWEDLRVRPY